MSDKTFKYNDGTAYERGMAPWSRSAGDVFLDWLAPSDGLGWVDVGCGNGAFTELIVQKCHPIAVEGIDPSEGQLEFARNRASAQLANFRQGDAMALPFSEDSFDVATMALVIFFVPDPAKGVAAMLRVVRPGGTVTTYAWDVLRCGSPNEPIWDEMRTLGVTPTLPPSAKASQMESMRDLWTSAGLEATETREILVQRTFEDFDEFWASTTTGSIGPQIAQMSVEDLNELKTRVRARLPMDVNKL
jgi:ubiquinone/menaquinone biosynthesis C-methylase UbiE